MDKYELSVIEASAKLAANFCGSFAFNSENEQQAYIIWLKTRVVVLWHKNVVKSMEQYEISVRNMAKEALALYGITVNY